MERKKILIIEEEKIFNNILKKHFENKDYDVEFSHIGHKHMDQLIEFQPDIIIMDTDMPSQVGYDFTKEIVNNASLKGIPLIIMSASGQDFSVKKGISMGAFDYVSKPIDLEALSDKVVQYLN